MIKRITAIVTAVFISVVCLAMPLLIVSAENVTGAQKFNVVFVVDASNSMNATDSQGWRFEAIDEFLSLLSLTGNYVGTVVFNGDVQAANGVSQIESKEDKQAASNTVKGATPVGYTNIGEALAKANELIKNGNKSLPSIILLLSDGNTEMPSEADFNRSINAQNNAIVEAKNNNTKIYCIGLNANGKMKIEELQNISDQTNGFFKIVSRAEDLQDVFKEFYVLIYNTSVDPEQVELPAVKEFSVPKIGVEEVNILIEGTTSSIKLTQPSGNQLSDTELRDITTRGNHFTNIKIDKPLSGKWKIELGGEAGQYVVINFIPNLNVSLLTDKPETESYKRDEMISIKTKIVSEGNEITDASVYQEYPALLRITNANNSDDSHDVEMQAIDDVYKADIAFDTTGTYYVTPMIDIGYGKIAGNSVSVSVGNAVPKAKNKAVKYTNYGMKFGKETFEYKLSDLVFDEDGDALTFNIDKFTFSTDDLVDGTAKIEDGVLKVMPTKECSGTFSIIASDEYGASCEFNVKITYRNLLRFILMIALIVLIVGGMIFAVIHFLCTHKKFNGSITVTAYDDDNGSYSSPATEWPNARPIDVQMICGESETFGGIKGKFIGSGKDFVTFIAKGNAYYNGMKVKKVRIADGCSERISSTEDGMKGIEVQFARQDSQY